jgi:hypothetical protein
MEVVFDNGLFLNNVSSLARSASRPQQEEYSCRAQEV